MASIQTGLAKGLKMGDRQVRRAAYHNLQVSTLSVFLCDCSLGANMLMGVFSGKNIPVYSLEKKACLCVLWGKHNCVLLRKLAHVVSGGKHACAFWGKTCLCVLRGTCFHASQKNVLVYSPEKNMPACSVEKTCPCFPLKNMPVTACSLENMPVKNTHLLQAVCNVYTWLVIMLSIGYLDCL